MPAASIRVVGIHLHVHELVTRFPFRYGIATMTRVPHLMLAADVEIDGRVARGYSADNLVPKWFTKDPATSLEQDIEQMIGTIRAARDAAIEAGGFPSVFELWRAIYQRLDADAVRSDEPPLLWGLGVSLVERAVIDAFCRATGVRFGDALRRNLFAIDLGWMYAELRGAAPGDLLPAEPSRQIIVRHTVGLSDPLSDEQIPPAERVEDGLPQSLRQCIRTYGLTHFKIKLSGDVEQDLGRLRELAGLLGDECTEYAFTLDANENYRAVGPFRELWERLSREGLLEQFLSKLIFVEQPLHRDVALGEEARRELLAWPDRPAMIIDESGATPRDLTDALAGGYVGTSHKNCKGVIKGIAAACLLEHRRQQNPAGQYILSGEDLSNTGPIALLQDFAVIAALGLTHVERNGHHYFRGLGAWPADMQRAITTAHPDVYCTHAGVATLNLDGGRVRVDSTIQNPFGTGLTYDLRSFTEI